MIVFRRYYKIDPKQFVIDLGKKFKWETLDFDRVKGQVFIKCPFHSKGQERTPSANISLVKNNHAEEGDFYCFGCKTKGHISPILTKLFGSRELAEKWVESRYVDSVTEEEGIREVKKVIIPEEVEVKKQVFELNPWAYESETSYYESRGIPDFLVKEYKLGFIDSDDADKRKVYFPVFNKEGEVVFFQTRNIHSKKFYLPKGAKKVLWNANNIGIGPVVVCESVFNALTCIKNGFQAVAIFGSGDELVYQQLLDLPSRKFYIALDGDTAGDKGSKEIASVLKNNNRFVERIRVNEKGKDLNDYAKLSNEEFMAKWETWREKI